MKSDRADSMFEGVEGAEVVEIVEITESLYYTKPIRIPRTNDEVVYKLQSCHEDTAFAIYCLLQDSHYLRLFSARAWREFKLGAIGIQTATICTNVAVAKIEELCDRFLETVTDFKRWEMHLKIDLFLRDHCCYSKGDFISPECEDVTLARSATRRLGFLSTSLLCGRVLGLTVDAYTLRQGQFWGETLDDMRLLKSLYQLSTLEELPGRCPFVCRHDCMYTTGSCLLRRRYEVDTVFAAQMLWDIQQEIDTGAADTENILRQVGRDLRILYDQYMPEWCHRSPSLFKRMNDECLFIDQIINGGIDKLQKDLEVVEQQCPTQCPLPGFRLLRHVPLLVGQLVDQQRYSFQDFFMDIANDWGHVLTAIHFYNAAKESGALQTTQWEDMEWVIDHQNFHWIFAGEPPTKNEEYSSRLCLVYGLDQTKFASDRKPTKTERVKNDIHLKGVAPRRLESSSRFGKIYMKRKQESPTTSATPSRKMLLDVLEEFANNQLDQASPYGEPNNIGFLIAVKDAYEEDEEAVNFDIFDFHLRCSRLLKEIRKTCLEEAPEDYPAVRFDGEDGLNPTIAELLRDLTGCSRHHHRVWPKAVELLRNLIEKEGSTCAERAWARMKMSTLESPGAHIETPSDDSASDNMMETPPLGSGLSSGRSDSHEPKTKNSICVPHQMESPENSTGSNAVDVSKESNASETDQIPWSIGSVEV